MILDASAVIAVVRDEPDAAVFVEAMQSADRLAMSTATALEIYLVSRSGRAQGVQTFLSGLDVELIPFDIEHLARARQAAEVYGRHSDSPAKLHFGDCIAYALAKSTGEPLLFKGDDFTHTDVESALS